jgi:arginase family enzyme
MINRYLEPYIKQPFNSVGLQKEETLGDKVVFFDGSDNWFTNVKPKMVLVGVEESRNAFDNKSCDQAPALIRQWLYSMRGFVDGSVICDAGNVRGNKVIDRYNALREVSSFFLQKKAVVIVLGGSQELTRSLVESLSCQQQEMSLVVVDAMVDAGESGDFSSRNWLSAALLNGTAAKINLTVAGLQNFLVSNKESDFLENNNAEVFGLGKIRRELMQNIEVPFRDADLTSIDFRVLENQPLVEGVLSPQGLDNYDACAMCRYAGLSDRLKVFGLFETPFSQNQKDSTGWLAAQMIWHFIEGVNNRFYDYPVASTDNYRSYMVAINGLNEPLKFYQNPINDRWWLVVGDNDGVEKLVACMPEDYKSALQNELPDKWWHYYV